MGVLQGEVSLVTGAGRRVGRGVARAGSQAVVAARTLAKLEEVDSAMYALGGKVFYVPWMLP